MKYKNQTALKNFKPNIKLNHDICNPCKLMMKQLVREVCQLLVFDFLKKKKQTNKKNMEQNLTPNSQGERLSFDS